MGAYYCDGIDISNNVINDCGRHGIWIPESANVLCQGNTAVNNNAKNAGTFDILIGNSSGANTNTIDIDCSGNNVGKMSVNYDYCTRVIVSRNTIRTSFTGAGTKAQHQVYNNYIAGTWTP